MPSLRPLLALLLWATLPAQAASVTIDSIEAGATLSVNASAVASGDVLSFADGETLVFETSFNGRSVTDVVESWVDMPVAVHAIDYASHPGTAINLVSDLGYTPFDIFVITSADPTPFVLTGSPLVGERVQVLGLHALVPEATLEVFGDPTAASGAPDYSDLYYGSVEVDGSFLGASCDDTRTAIFNHVRATSVAFNVTTAAWSCGDENVAVQQIDADDLNLGRGYASLSVWRATTANWMGATYNTTGVLNEDMPELRNLAADPLIWFKARNPVKWALYPALIAHGDPSVASFDFFNYDAYDDNVLWEVASDGGFVWDNDWDCDEYLHFIGPGFTANYIDRTPYCSGNVLSFYGSERNWLGSPNQLLDGQRGSGGSDFWRELLATQYGVGPNLTPAVFVMRLRDGWVSDWYGSNFNLGDGEDMLIVTDNTDLDFNDGIDNFWAGSGSHYVVEDGLAYLNGSPTDDSFAIGSVVLEMTDTLSLSATNDYLGGDDLSSTMYVAYRPSGLDSVGHAYTKVPMSYDPATGGWSVSFRPVAQVAYDAYVVATQNDGLYGKTVEVPFTWAPNHAPNASSAQLITPMDTALAITLSGSDADGDVLSATLLDAPTHGSLSGSEPTLTYTPDPGYLGSDSFSFVVSDGALDSLPGTIAIEVIPEAGPSGEPPVANDDQASTQEDEPVTIDVLVNDTDPDGDPTALVIVGVTGAAHGSADSDGTSVVFSPEADWSGPPQTVTYTVMDPDGRIDIGSVTISISPVDDAPIGADDVFIAQQDSPLGVAAPGVLDNDSDLEGDALIAMIDTEPAHGSVTVRVDGGFDYTPDPGFSGEDSFTYLANDGELSSEPIRVRLVVCAAGGEALSSGTSNGKGDCGCSSATHVGGAVWLLGLISVGLRRRRHDVG